MSEPSPEFEALRAKAIEGNAEAMNRLALCYYSGNGCKKDPKEAVKWLRLAVRLLNPHAQCNLAVFLSQGDGCERNIIEAVTLLNMAIDNGYSKAQEYLRAIFPQLEDAMIKDSEDTELRYQVAVCQSKGNGCEKNIIMAAVNLNIAIFQGSRKAEGYLRTIIMPQLKEAAMDEDAEAQYEWAFCLENGHGCEKNLQSALAWYNYSAMLGDDKAQTHLGIALIEGRLGVQDRKEGKRWLLKAARKGNFLAEEYLDDLENE